MNEFILSCIIAEDTPEIIRLLVLYAGFANLQVKDTVKSAKALVESVRKNQPDILLVDIGLSRSDGLIACRQLLEEGFTPRIIVISGSLHPNHIIDSIKLGVIDYLRKPFRQKDFLEAIQKAHYRIKESNLAMKVIRENNRLIKVTKKYRDIEINEQVIAYVEKIDKRRYHIFLIDGTHHETSTNLDLIKQQCSETIFSPHKSYLVNYNHIKIIIPNITVEGNYDIVLKNIPYIIPLTRRYHGDYLKLKNRLSK